MGLKPINVRIWKWGNMCGIIGYIGKENSVPIIVDGLKKLEYRGYDSAGIAVYKDGIQCD